MSAIPCQPWTTPTALPCDLPGDAAATAIEAASFVLWALSGRRHGVCSATVRPCVGRCSPAGGWHRWGEPWRPVLYDGEWLNVCGHDAGVCGCGPTSEIVLPLSPVVEVSAVEVDGVALVEGTDYRLDGNRLVRLGGERWPTEQNLDLVDGDPGTWSVAFTYGVEIDALGVLAAGELACEFGKALTGASGCRLPQRVTSLTRQGVSMALIDPQEFLRDGRTGFYLADLWLNAVNPDGLRSASRVYSPDLRRPRYVS